MPAFPSGAGHKNQDDAFIKNGESAEVQTRGAEEGGGGNNDEAGKNESMFSSFKRKISKDWEKYENRLDFQQRQIDDFQRRQIGEDREDRLRHRAQQRQNVLPAVPNCPFYDQSTTD
jgi:hypothetical protein